MSEDKKKSWFDDHVIVLGDNEELNKKIMEKLKEEVEKKED
tara:strand:+ start:208 stop:330 length:123 start_codon:yes stop_codon:yes gene_type:complete